jgi:hypothetical protein
LPAALLGLINAAIAFVFMLLVKTGQAVIWEQAAQTEPIDGRWGEVNRSVPRQSTGWAAGGAGRRGSLCEVLLARFNPHLYAIFFGRDGTRPFVAVGLLSFVQACRQPLF